MPQRKSLTETVLDGLLEGVFSGHYAPGSALPSEAEIGAEYSVSRVTVREALRTLQAGGIVDIRRGIGTFVNPPATWTSLETVLRYASQYGEAGAAADDLVEVRRMVEVGAAGLAASRRSSSDLTELALHLETMRSTDVRGEAEQFTVADTAFHDVILRASGNMFVPVLFEPLRRLVHDGRVRSLAAPPVRANAIRMHDRVLAALVAGDPVGARREMDAHMDQVADDLLRTRRAGPGAPHPTKKEDR